MSNDIGKILENWDYRLGRVDARRVTGDDGSEKLQMRIDLGLLQMNAQFRPDGKRPFGHPTLLDHFLLRLEKHRNKNGGDDDDFSINSDECAKLQLPCRVQELVSGGTEILRLELCCPGSASDQHGDHGDLRAILHVMPEALPGRYCITLTRLQGNTFQFHAVYRTLRMQLADLLLTSSQG